MNYEMTHTVIAFIFVALLFFLLAMLWKVRRDYSYDKKIMNLLIDDLGYATKTIAALKNEKATIIANRNEVAAAVALAHIKKASENHHNE